MTKRYVITAFLENGDKWETTRHTFGGMDTVVQDILKDPKVVRFVVEEK